MISMDYEFINYTTTRILSQNYKSRSMCCKMFVISYRFRMMLININFEQIVQIIFQGSHSVIQLLVQHQKIGLVGKPKKFVFDIKQTNQP